MYMGMSSLLQIVGFIALQLMQSSEEDKWKCRDGKRNINLRHVCDDLFHCTDGSDENEAFCVRWKCTKNMWKCKNNKCLDETKVCNGVYYTSRRIDGCSDKSDEDPEMCGTWNCLDGMWRCKDGHTCIEEGQVCDGRAQCTDKSDESKETCQNFTCLDNYWKCRDNEKCISREYIMNGIKHCGDGSDEIIEYHVGRHCRADEYQCDNGQCLPSDKLHSVCDGVNNSWPGCIDGSDEAHCENWECLKGFVKCAGNLQCVRSENVCGKHKALWQSVCSDASENINDHCATWECKPDHWKCNDNLTCVSVENIMDGRKDCKDGSDEIKTYHVGRNCSEGQYQCDNLQCIDPELVCDKIWPDCYDGSDETHCEEWECLADAWKCVDNLQCIDAEYLCDGYYSECKDGSDENKILCGCRLENEWPCMDGTRCVMTSNVCDGITHCKDQSDEYEGVCNNWNCTKGKWKCHKDPKCVDSNNVCDGIPHCLDLSDEVKDMCNNHVCDEGHLKCANNLQCVAREYICDDNVHCFDGSDEMCTASCLKSPLVSKSIVRMCPGQDDLCFAAEKYCDGVADCSDGSDETGLDCNCKDWGLISCKINNASLCIHPEWVDSKETNEDELVCDGSLMSDIKEHFISVKSSNATGGSDCVVVSAGGEDEQSCLSDLSEIGCSTLNYALNQGVVEICLRGKISNKVENIILKNNHKNKYVVDIFCMDCTLENFTCLISGLSEPIGNIAFIDLVVNKGLFKFNNVKAIFKNSSLSHIYFTGYGAKSHPFDYIEIAFQQSVISCNHSCNEYCGLHYVQNSLVKLSSQQSKFNSARINLTVIGATLSLQSTTFRETKIALATKSYLPIAGMIQFVETFFYNFRKERLKTNEVMLLIQNPVIMIAKSIFKQQSIIIKTKKGIFPVKFFSLRIMKSRFDGSTRTGKGGAVFVLSEFKGSMVFLNHCSFSENTVYRPNNEILALGGAIYVEGIALNMSILGSAFSNNFASDSGMALYTSLGVSLFIGNSSFLYEINRTDDAFPSMLFVVGILHNLNGSIKITQTKSKPFGQNLQVLSIAKGINLHANVSCPLWYKHDIKYSVSSHENPLSNPFQLITGLSYNCLPCPESFYTPIHSSKQLIFPVSTKPHLAMPKQCLPCPHGAICSGSDVIPRPKYWGYWYKGELFFAKCPSKYCCSGRGKEPCTRYNYCTGNRTNVLCGVCQDGYSVSIITGKCIPDDECGNDHWFWPLVFLGTMVYAIWYTFLGNIFEPFFNFVFLKSCPKIRKSRKTLADTQSEIATTTIPKLTDSSRSHSITDQFAPFSLNVETGKPNELQTIDQPLNPTGADDLDADMSSETAQNLNRGYFGIFNNFLQMTAAMNIQIEYSTGNKSQRTLLTMLIEAIRGFVSVKISDISKHICPIKGLTTVERHLFNLAFTLGIYSSWLLIFICTILLSNLVDQMTALCKCKFTVSLKPIRQNLVKGLVRIIKFTYATLCGIIFTSVMCISIGSKYVWWYDATNVCLETWQVVMIILGFLYAIPFPFALFMGMKLSAIKHIDASLFIALCLCPGGTLLYILVKKILNYNREGQNTCSSQSETTEAIVSVLQGPYRKDIYDTVIYWEAMVFLRRLLTTLIKLVGSEFVQMLILTVLWAMFLIQHVYVYPFKVRSSNHVETLSLFLLLMVAIIKIF